MNLAHVINVIANQNVISTLLCNTCFHWLQTIKRNTDENRIKTTFVWRMFKSQLIS
jgi:hypothetical protein